MHTKEVPIFTNQSITQRRWDSVYRRGTYIYQSINYTKDVVQCMQKRCLYIPINQLHRGGKASYTEEVSIYTNQSITQMKYDSSYIRGTSIYQSFNYRGGRTVYTE